MIKPVTSATPPNGQRPIAEKRLRELIGHRPIQVFVGMLLGIAIGLLATM